MCFQEITPGFQDNGTLTVLSYGAGQDSTWLLYKLALDPAFRRIHAPGRLLVVGSDTGDEHPETYAHVQFTREFCEIHGVEFCWLSRGDGYHSDAWATLFTQYYRNNTIGSAAFSRTCTSNLKTGPTYRFLAAWLRSQGYGMTSKDAAGPLRAFAARHGRIRFILGFAAKEERRVEKTLKLAASDETPAYRRDCISFSFPLVDMGLDRGAIQREIKEMGLPLPPPSVCMRCFFQSPTDLIYLSRNHPDKFAEWKEREAAKLTRFVDKGDKNLGVYGKRTLQESLDRANYLFPDITDEELETNRMTHGHSITNGY